MNFTYLIGWVYRIDSSIFYKELYFFGVSKSCTFTLIYFRIPLFGTTEDSSLKLS